MDTDIKKTTELTEAVLSEMTELYKNGICYEINPTGNRHADMHGKVPVWIIWWQGEENAPDMVRICIDSVKRSVPEDICEIHLVTFQNIDTYISLPEWVAEKYNKGLISMAHLSDAVRMELLSDYGGLYVDATYLITEQLADSFFTEQDFFTLCNRGDRIMPFVGGRWAQNFMYRNPSTDNQTGLFFINYVKNAFYYYWASQNSIVNYYLMDFIIDIAYRTFPQVRALLDGIPDTNPDCLYMQLHMRDRYTRQLWDRLTRQTHIFKMTYKYDRVEKGSLLEQILKNGY